MHGVTKFAKISTLPSALIVDTTPAPKPPAVDQFGAFAAHKRSLPCNIKTNTSMIRVG